MSEASQMSAKQWKLFGGNSHTIIGSDYIRQSCDMTDFSLEAIIKLKKLIE